MVISAPTAIVIRLSDRKLYRDPEVFRGSGIETGRVAPSSVINPADAGPNHWRPPVIGSERIRRHARRKVREPRPPQRSISIPFSRHKCLHSNFQILTPNFFLRVLCFLRAPPQAGASAACSSLPVLVFVLCLSPRHRASALKSFLRSFGCGSAALWGRRSWPVCSRLIP